MLLNLFRAPSLFGEMEVLDRRNFLENVVTLEPSQVLVLSGAAFHAAVHSSTRFAAALALDRLREHDILAKERARYVIRDAEALRRRTGTQLGLFYRLGGEARAPASAGIGQPPHDALSRTRKQSALRA